ncbi:MFS transporter [Prescottella soli]|uniref:MFS transporter n=1 Tax=Prescottella soli TaxID=1543852 RepID=A0ABW9FZ67_9NOCA
MTRSSVSLSLLALGVFSIITTEMGVVGVLPQVADRLGVSTSTAGLLVGVFALVVAACGPFMTLAASRIDRRTVLAATMGVFAISNAVYAVTTSFPVMLVFRILPALFHPVFFSVALTAAVRLNPGTDPARAAARVFAGVTAGFAFGVPLTSYVGGHLDLAAAFWIAAAIDVVALVGIVSVVPRMPADERLSYRDQLSVLRSRDLWLSIASVVFLFAAMFSVYGFFAEYLSDVTGMNETWLSAMLLVFGVVMIFGNFGFAALLRASVVRTVVAFPVLLAVVFAAAFAVGGQFAPMVVVVAIWAAVHSGGLIVGQTWLGRDAHDAPEFGNALFVSFSNLGITLGTTVGGWTLATAGTHALPWTGVVFAVVALVLVGARLAAGTRDARPGEPSRASA